MADIPKSRALVPKKAGRPPIFDGFDPTFCDTAAEMCSRGATIAELAAEFGVNRATIYRWMAKYKGFADVIRIAREAADERVGFSLYERAVGYTYNAVKIMQHEGKVICAEYLEHVPPDVGAQKHWLANRQPDKWRETRTHELTVGEPFMEMLRAISGDKAKVIAA